MVLTSAEPPDRRRLIMLVVAWSVPMIAAMPIGSRDLWAYAAQGNLDHHGLDPYTHSPQDLPGVFTDNVSKRWIGATTPYGPLWLLIGRTIAAICGNHVQISMFVLRLPVFIGVLVTIWVLPRIADRLGIRADRVLWMVMANPLTVVLGLGGGHNDLLMSALMVLGLLCLVQSGGMVRTLGASAALMAAAAAIKSPAAIGAMFVVPIWLQLRAGSLTTGPIRRAFDATGVAAISALASFAVVSAISGHGLGWVKQVSSAAPVVSWMSFPTAAAMLVKLAHGTSDGAMTLDPAMERWRTSGLVLAAILIVGLWAKTTWDATRERPSRLTPMAAFAIALIVIVVLGPAVQPWYFGWTLPFLALTPLSRRMIGVIVGSSFALLIMIRPLGTGLQMDPVLPLIVALGAALGIVFLRGLTIFDPSSARPAGSTPADHDPDRARPGVSPHRGPDL
jgi:alpha-1,6-mannosyltransferase